MPFYKHIGINSKLKQLCNVQTVWNTDILKHYATAKGRGMTKNMRQFFESDPELLDIMPHIPPKYLRINTASEHHYLISPKVAKNISEKILPFLDLSGKQLIAETNAGLGLITAELLDRGVNLVRMYEPCSEFRTELRDFGKIYPNRVELFTKDIFHLNRYAYMDKHDRLKRVENLFRNVPKRSWTDEPFMSIVGPMNGYLFLYNLLRAVAFQIIPAIYGRIQIFAIMKAKDYAILAATPKDSPKLYKKITILSNLFYDIELLGTFPKRMFVPWMGRKEINLTSIYKDLNLNVRYLVRIEFKKNLPMEAEQLVHFIYFLKQFYGTGSAYIIPTLEKWLPNSGINIICPTLKHEDFNTEIDIFTKFRDLYPQQVFGIYREMTNHPLYKESSFMSMIQNELMQAETIESDMADVEFESTILEDFQETINESRK